jgi:hypothetical protein
MDVGGRERGQAHTVEAFSASLVLLAGVVFALQVTAVTPLTASTASQHIENQMEGTANGVLDQSVEDGSLKRMVLFYNNSTGDFHGSGPGNEYTVGGPPNDFGQRLNETFRDRGIAFEVTVVYADDGRVAEETIVSLGSPSDNAVMAHRTVTVYDDDPLYDADGTNNASVNVSSTNTTPYFGGSDPKQFDQSPNSQVYNVFKVELTLWQM